MKQLKFVVPAAIVALLSACSSMGGSSAEKASAAQPTATVQAPATQTQSAPVATKVDSVKEVAYACGAKGADKLRVTYGMSGNEVVVAQALFQGKASPVLPRVADETDSNSNVFSSNGITWTADQATAANVDQVDGNMLTQQAVQTVNGKQVQVSQIVARYCKLDKVATAKLAAAKK
ncbi:hypothetical protein PL75_08145 [Neisseria arctica]|uniref:Lipoprotein n=1 Tax=Neisseria arctica TaxID=1470200 RepID=A0A0J0YQV4_9NEIS|nr:hypothetical protein [Neisseria arctica]KLT72502.1 hypothetical protein PL75_08145 [Neisseria arctica]UOO86405.1 hypothetical protein LVJ86_09370 [Neisseria arctica]